MFQHSFKIIWIACDLSEILSKIMSESEIGNNIKFFFNLDNGDKSNELFN